LNKSSSYFGAERSDKVENKQKNILCAFAPWREKIMVKKMERKNISRKGAETQRKIIVNWKGE